MREWWCRIVGHKYRKTHWWGIHLSNSCLRCGKPRKLD